MISYFKQTLLSESEIMYGDYISRHTGHCMGELSFRQYNIREELEKSALPWFCRRCKIYSDRNLGTILFNDMEDRRPR